MSPYYQAILAAPNPTPEQWEEMSFNQQVMHNIKVAHAVLLRGVEERQKERD
jgi:hypothetical protein